MKWINVSCLDKYIIYNNELYRLLKKKVIEIHTIN